MLTQADLAALAETAQEQASRRRLGPMFWIAVAWLGLVVLLALLAPLLPFADPDKILNGPISAGLFHGHNLLGTDSSGRDLFARTIYGARVSLLIGFVSILFAVGIGGTLGIIAGYYRGKTESGLMALMDVSLAFPAIVLSLLFITFLGQDLHWILLVIGVVSIAPVCRLTRANTLVFAQREFVTAARGLGAKNARILRQEILPNVAVPMASLALLGVAIAIIAEGALAFLGASVKGDTVTWGKLIVAGASGNELRGSPLSAFVPIAFLFFTVLSLNFVGERLRTHFQPQEAGGGR